MITDKVLVMKCLLFAYWLYQKRMNPMDPRVVYPSSPVPGSKTQREVGMTITFKTWSSHQKSILIHGSFVGWHCYVKNLYWKAIRNKSMITITKKFDIVGEIIILTVSYFCQAFRKLEQEQHLQDTHFRTQS